MTRLILTLNLGTTSAIQSGDDAARALTLTAAEIANTWDGLTLPEVDPRPIHDRDGVQVGEWQITDEQTRETEA